MVIVCATSKNIKVTLAIFAQVHARALRSDAAAHFSERFEIQDVVAPFG